jgi:hypothetical protein
MPGEGDDGVGKMHPKPGLAKCPQNTPLSVSSILTQYRATQHSLHAKLSQKPRLDRAHPSQQIASKTTM